MAIFVTVKNKKTNQKKESKRSVPKKSVEEKTNHENKAFSPNR